MRRKLIGSAPEPHLGAKSNPRALRVDIYKVEQEMLFQPRTSCDMPLAKRTSNVPTPDNDYLNPINIVRNFRVNRYVVKQFARREVEARYKGSYLGMFWSVANPLMMVAVYAFVFAVIFKFKWGARPDETSADFVLTLFCGIIIFSIFSECVSRAPGLVLGYPNYVRKVVFPLEILPVAVLISTLVHAALSLATLLAGSLIFGQGISRTLPFLPVVLLPLCALTLGLSWLLAAAGVFIRDIGHPVSMLVQILMFVSGVFFPLSAVPEEFRSILTFNPLATIMEDARRVIMWGQLPDWSGELIITLISLAIMQLGFLCFMKSKRAFADVL